MVLVSAFPDLSTIFIGVISYRVFSPFVEFVILKAAFFERPRATIGRPYDVCYLISFVGAFIERPLSASQVSLTVAFVRVSFSAFA